MGKSIQLPPWLARKIVFFVVGDNTFKRSLKFCAKYHTTVQFTFDQRIENEPENKNQVIQFLMAMNRNRNTLSPLQLSPWIARLVGTFLIGTEPSTLQLCSNIKFENPFWETITVLSGRKEIFYWICQKLHRTNVQKFWKCVGKLFQHNEIPSTATEKLEFFREAIEALRTILQLVPFFAYLLGRSNVQWLSYDGTGRMDIPWKSYDGTIHDIETLPVMLTYLFSIPIREYAFSKRHKKERKLFMKVLKTLSRYIWILFPGYSRYKVPGDVSVFKERRCLLFEKTPRIGLLPSSYHDWTWDQLTSRHGVSKDAIDKFWTFAYYYMQKLKTGRWPESTEIPYSVLVCSRVSRHLE